MIEDALFTLLKTSSVGSLVLDSTKSPNWYRIFPLVIPQHAYGEATKQSCVVYTQVGESRTVRFDGSDNVVDASFQFDSYAMTFSAARELANALKAALLDYNGTIQGVEIKTANLTNKFALEDPEPGLYRISQSWTIWYVDI